jgi:hypothetical protein
MTARYLALIDEWHRRRRAAGAIDAAPAETTRR